MTIDTIFIHHSGGTDRDALASSAHLSFDDINAWSKVRPDFVGYRAHLSSLGFYFPYNFGYDHKNRRFYQGRKIGEETMAQAGYNFTAISICMFGNYSKVPLSSPSRPVDTLYPFMVDDITNFVDDLINGNVRGLLTTPDAKLDLSAFRIYPHRKVAKKDCYGSAIPDNLFVVSLLTKKYKLLPFAQFMGWLKRQTPPVPIGGSDEHSCAGFIS